MVKFSVYLKRHVFVTFVCFYAHQTSILDVQNEAESITEHSLTMAPRGRANKPRQTVHKPQTKDKQSNQLPLPHQGDHNARQDPLNATHHENMPI